MWKTFSGTCLAAFFLYVPPLIASMCARQTLSPAAFTDDSFANPLVLLKSLFHVLSSHSGTLCMLSGAASQSGRELKLAYAHRAWVISFPRECTTTSLQRNFPSHFIWKRGRAKKALGPSYSIVKHQILPMCKTSNPPRVIRKRVRRSCFCQFRCNLLPLFDTFLCVLLCSIWSGSALCSKSEFWNRDVAQCVPCHICKQYPKTPSCDTCEYIPSKLRL